MSRNSAFGGRIRAARNELCMSLSRLASLTLIDEARLSLIDEGQLDESDLNETSGIYATFAASHRPCEVERLDLGSLRGKYVVESARVGEYVISIVHDPQLQRRT